MRWHRSPMRRGPTSRRSLRSTPAAPIAPGLQDELSRLTGVSIKNCYGMTETTAPTHLTPWGQEVPVDRKFNALSIGVPGFGTDARIVSEAGQDLPPGEVGELWMRGPQIMAGYWNKAAKTAACLTDGWMHSGDVAFMNENGWFFLVDRRKDMIWASGFKVWPREVEDALYQHAAAREAAEASPAELIAHTRRWLTGYKCPREIRILPELPKTLSGKIQRKALRDTYLP